VISAQVLGYVGLGVRRSGRGYDREDLELVVTMANQAAIAVQNARSYRLLQELNRGLAEKISARTRELEHSNDALATAYQRLQAAQAQLIQAEKMASLGELVAGVAHELNNPLTFIVGNIAPIREQLETLRAVAHNGGDARMLAICDEMAQILGVIASGAERTATIVKDLRTFSRVEEGTSSVADLRAGLRTTINLLQPRWKDRITIHTELDDLPLVECDLGHVNQVFMNILSNACDAIHGRGNIWIRAEAQNGEVAIAIRDDGVGIAPELVARIFDPFFTTKDIGTGTGLGLAISHGIVQRHQGRITVTSARGAGSEFVVHLPVRVELRRRRSVA
jgi:signal transduction histidine kinase